MDAIEFGDWDGLNAAVQKIAKAHNKMRRRVEALEGEVERLTAALPDRALADEAVEGASASTGSGSPAPGVFVSDPDCKACGTVKAPGRYQLTCESCSKIRNEIIRTKGADRTPIMFGMCVNCTAPKKASTTMLCHPCSGAFKEWKAEKGLN